MTICQLMTGTGGWPLTIVMTPDKRPFFAATYIPKQSRYGRKGLMTLLPEISTLWSEKRHDIESSAEQIVQALRQTSAVSNAERLDATVFDRTYEELSRSFDESHGGFGTTPKFPTAHNLSFLLRYWKRTGNERAHTIVERTLQQMRMGGIFDHIGYGFHRYSTDARWLVPHFEKMLYDQALLAIAYTEAYQVTRSTEFAAVVNEIFTYVLRDMTLPQGGFYSAEDADSEGEEGKFYVWAIEEIMDILGDDAPFFQHTFNIEATGNYLEESTRRKTGKNIIHLRSLPSELAQKMNIPQPVFNKRVDAARSKLFAARDGRVHPHKDDKTLTSWNGLMIAALAKGGSVFNNREFISAAERAASFILTNLRTPDGRLLHRYREGDAAVSAHADDYAFFIWGLRELYSATFDIRHLKTALELNEQFIAHYWDVHSGGFFFTADDAEHALVRQKHSYDGALPSANSVALQNLLHLAHITADPELTTLADQLTKTFASRVTMSGAAHTHFLTGLSFAFGPTFEVIIVGDGKSEDTKSMLRLLKQAYLPDVVLMYKNGDADHTGLTQIAEYTKQYKLLDGKATAYVCSNYVCQQPTTDMQTLLSMLRIEENEE
jgi:uncharacterized protein YyaL (SSP411 family)